jgi:hypothetical protein
MVREAINIYIIYIEDLKQRGEAVPAPKFRL